MATKKRKKSTGAAVTAASDFKGKPLGGRAKAGKLWDPTEARQTMAPEPEELNAPRPSGNRYPISNEAFQILKEGAPKAKLPKLAATLAKDSGKKEELAAMAAAPVAEGAGLEPALAPTAAANFAGISATGWIPPDCTAAVGPSHVLLSVNSSLAIYNKTGGAALLQRTLTQWFANLVPGFTIFDPKALYDQHAARWVLLAAAFRNNPNKSVFLLSVSATSNPLGQWRNYQFDAMVDGTTPTNNWADFPALGVDNQAFYVTANMFTFGAGGGFQYAKIRVIPKAGPYSGGPAPFTDFVRMRNADNTLCFTIQPCHTFGAPQVEYLVNSGFPSANFVTLWRLVNPVAAPALTRVQVAVSPYSLPPNADQSGGAPPLNTGDVRILHAIFRGDSVWTALTTAHNWGAGSNKAAIEWLQIRAAAGTLVQQGVYGASALHYFYPAVCPDNNGNMDMVFSRSGTGEFGSILYTGRKATDPLGTLQSSAMLKAGVAHYSKLDNSGRNRWGDYNGVASDPSNSRVIWFYSMYASAVDTWGTWVGSAFF